MEHQLTELFAQWGQLGNPVLLGHTPEVAPETPERLVARSTRWCRDSSRLTWLVLGWLSRNPDRINPESLLELTREFGDLAVLGLLCDAARERCPHPVFDRITRECRPLPREEIFFHRVARSRLASSLVRQQPLEVFKRWNFLSNELSYL